MNYLEMKRIRIIDKPVRDDGSSLMYRENGSFYTVLPSLPQNTSLPDGHRDIDAALVIIQGRECALFTPVQEAQKIFNSKMVGILDHNKK
jgi:hypothetical protein